MTKPKVTFWSGVGTVTGANFMVEYDNLKFLVDCGMLQGVAEATEINHKSFPYNPAEIEYLFVTHAHIDHIGRIAKLVKDGFNGKIFSTDETKHIAEIMLADAAHIESFRAQEEGSLPSYDMADVRRAISLWHAIPYHKRTSFIPSISVELFDAGHILGSSMFRFGFGEGKESTSILFTGDLGNSPSTLLPDTEIVNSVEYLVMDSVYGDRNHDTKEAREAKLKEALTSAIARGGTVLMPVFSLERTQVILYELNELIEKKIIQSIPVFLDSPLAIRVTDIYEKISTLYNSKVKADISTGDKIFDFPKLKSTARVAESQEIRKITGPKIIIAGSGMSTAGRILSHEAHYLPDPNTTLLITGYQAPNTLGRLLEEGAKQVEIDGEMITVKAKIVKIDGYSGHKDADNLLEFVSSTAEGPLKKVFVVLGEPKSSMFLAQRIRDYVGVEAMMPERGKGYEL